MKKVLFSVILIILCTLRVNALELNSQNAVLYNLNDNTIIYEKNKDSITSIASLTKIMTTIVAIENIDDYNKEVVINSDMLKGLKEENAYVIYLQVGEKVTYNDLLYGTFLASGADAARGLSYTVSGSDSSFVELMNKKAKELNLVNTHFTNATGLDTDNQSSTVDEVARLLQYALKNDKFSEIFYSDTYTFSNNKHTVKSSLKETGSYYNLDVSNILGGKTGYTLNAGRCLASVAYDSVNDIRYMLVTTNASTSTKYYHVKDAVDTYNYYFTNYKYHNLIDNNDIILTLPTKYVKEKEIKFISDKDYKVFYENTFNKENVKLEYTGLELLQPNLINNKLKKGYKIGTIDVIYNDTTYETIDVVLDMDIKFSILEFVKVNILYVSLTVILLIGILVLLLKKKKRK